MSCARNGEGRAGEAEVGLSVAAHSSLGVLSGSPAAATIVRARWPSNRLACHPGRKPYKREK